MHNTLGNERKSPALLILTPHVGQNGTGDNRPAITLNIATPPRYGSKEVHMVYATFK
jgi:hypothetical protein